MGGVVDALHFQIIVVRGKIRRWEAYTVIPDGVGGAIAKSGGGANAKGDRRCFLIYFLI